MMDFFHIIHDYWLMLLIGRYPQGALGGLAATAILSALVLVISLPLGTLLALARMSPWPILRLPVSVWIYLVRGIPMLILVLWTYFLAPLVLGPNVGVFAVMASTLTLYQSAFICEIVRGALTALPSGQNEASRALGLGYFRTLIWVLLPQALYNAIPSLVSQFVYIIKETTVGYVINLEELTFSATQINNILLTKPFQVYLLLALGYYAICFTLSRLAALLEQRIGAKRTGASTARAA